MTDNAIAALAGALGVIGPLLIGYATGSFLAMLGAFCVTVSALLPWYSVVEVAAQYTESENGRRTDDTPR